MAMLERAGEEGTLCFPAHFRKTSAERLKRDGDGFDHEWVEA